MFILCGSVEQFAVGAEEDVVVLQLFLLELSLIAVFAALEVSLVGLMQLQVHTVTHVYQLDRQRVVRQFVYDFPLEDVLEDHPSVFGEIEAVLTEQRNEAQKEVLILSAEKHLLTDLFDLTGFNIGLSFYL